MRKTFGIINPITKQIYEDIEKSFIEDRILTLRDLKDDYIKASISNDIYKISIDYRTLKEVTERKKVRVIISFQTRKDHGNIAFIRLYNSNRKRKEYHELQD